MDNGGRQVNTIDEIIILSSDDESAAPPPPSQYYSAQLPEEDLKVKEEFSTSAEQSVHEQCKSNDTFPFFAANQTNGQVAAIETVRKSNFLQNQQNLQPPTPESGRASMQSSTYDFDQNTNQSYFENDASLLDLRMTNAMPKVQSTNRFFAGVLPQQNSPMTERPSNIAPNYASNFYPKYSNPNLNTPNSSFTSHPPTGLNFNYSAQMPSTSNSENYKAQSGDDMQNSSYHVNQQPNQSYFGGYQPYDTQYIASLVAENIKELFQDYELVPKKKKPNSTNDKHGNSSKRNPFASAKKPAYTAASAKYQRFKHEPSSNSSSWNSMNDGDSSTSYSSSPASTSSHEKSYLKPGKHFIKNYY